MFNFLPTVKGTEGKKKEEVKRFYSSDDDFGQWFAGNSQLLKDTAKEIPGELSKQVGQPAMRGFAAAASGLHSLGQRVQGAIDPTKTYEDYEREFSLDLKPEGAFQETLYGTNEKISAGSFGKEVRGGLGGDEAQPIDPVLGFMVGFADAVPGGKAGREAVQGSTKLATKVYQKFGPTIGKQIEQLGKEAMDMSLVKGAESTVANMLNKPKIDVTVQKLVDSFVDINKARTETEAARVAERATRAENAAKAIQQTEGVDALKAARSAMRGEMPQAELPNAAIARLDDEETNDLFNFIRNSDLRVYEKTNALEGLARVLGDPYYNGALPTPSQMRLLKDVFGEPFARHYNNTFQTAGAKVAETVAQVANVPRALMSSLDMSAPLRQGLLLSIDNPKNATKAFGSMVRYFFDDRYFNAAMDSINNSPMAPLRRSAGLELTDVTGQNFSLGTKEEAYMTDLASKIPIIGIGVRASERAYSGFLNKLRADVFDDVAKQMMEGGMRPELHSNEFEGVARFINVATGRGEIKGSVLKGSAPLLNAVFFSPRFLASRLQMFNPQFYYSLSPQARKMAARSVMKLVGTGMSVLALASLNKDVEIQADPRSSDFGKIKVGNYRYDIWGGFQQVAVLGARLITGETKSATSGKVTELDGEEYFGQTRLSVLTRFFRSKLAPVPGGAVDALEGQNVIGDEVTISQQLKSKLLPFYTQDLIEASEEEGLLHPSIKLAPGLFGIGVQRFEQKKNPDLDAIGLPKIPDLPPLPKLPNI